MLIEILRGINAQTSEEDVGISIQIAQKILNDVVNGIPTPVTLEQAMETVRITEKVFEKTGFGTPEKFLAAKNAKN